MFYNYMINWTQYRFSVYGEKNDETAKDFQMSRTIDIPFASFPGYKLKVASSIATTGLSKLLTEFDLRVSEAMILLFIEANPACLQSEIGRTLSIANPNLTPILGKLEARDLVFRRPVDGRSNGLHLTRAGAPFVKQMHAQMRAYEQQILNRLPAHLREPFGEALDILSS